MVTAICPVITLSPQDYDAVLFDLDGVLTQTASANAAAWKSLFDAFLEQRSADLGEPFVPFDVDADYRRYLDGKSRYDGAAAFLESRGIDLPRGAPGDRPDVQSIQALGDRKDGYFLKILKQQGVEAYEASIVLAQKLRAQQIKTAVVSSSNNCAAVLETAGIAQLFDVRVDGNDVAGLGLRGKPAPDAFLEAARRLGVEPARAVIVEDAIAGVEAGHAGNFGCVIGRRSQRAVAGAARGRRRCRGDQPGASPGDSGASVRLVAGVRGLRSARRRGFARPCAPWGMAISRRAAALAWARADGTHYPGTYLAGGYNRLRTDIAGRVVENEDLVNFPNWLALEFRIGDQDWFDERRVTLLSYRQELDLRRGMLLRTIRFEDDQGRRSLLQERRLVSMADMHLGALELTLTAENWSGARHGPFGDRRTRRQRGCEAVPEVQRQTSGAAGGRGRRRGRRLPAGAHLSVGYSCRPGGANASVPRRAGFSRSAREVIEEPGYIGQELTIDVSQGEMLVLEKLASFYTSRDHAISECGLEARKAMARAGRFEAVMADHVHAWRHLWRRFDVGIQPADPGFKLNVPMLLRLNMFHLLQTVSLHSIGLDIGVPARGWTGEAYQGHIFWDELFIFPFFNYRVPEITRSLLMYRYRRLGEARAAAQSAGHKGAMFPWQSGSDGREETQTFNLNPRSQRWVPDNSYLQRHVGSAIAYNVWQYFQVTHDLEFLRFYGAELILDIALFWSSMAIFNDERGRYEIRGVMGPDEFHDGYPDAATPGVNNNAYTNVMAVWVLCRAMEVLDLLSAMRRT